jgi:sec-independent protein translocase protein TatA
MNQLLLIGGLGTPEVIIIAIIVLLLFGGKKIPELMSGIGKGVKSFKAGLNDVQEEIKKDVSSDVKADGKKDSTKE